MSKMISVGQGSTPLWLRVGLFACLLSAGACPGPGAKDLPEFRPQARKQPGLQSFSESAPYTAVAAWRGRIYAGTPRGLVGFDEGTGTFSRITTQDGLSGERITALSSHPESGLWAATDRGLSRLSAGKWTNHTIDDPPGTEISALVATEWGVWAGGPKGLGRLEGKKWTTTLPGARVTALLPDLGHRGLWVGTDGEGIHYIAKGASVSHNPTDGQVIRHVVGLSNTEEGGLVAIGRDRQQRQRLTFYDGQHWTAYALHPSGRLGWIHQIAGRTIFSHDDRILVLKRFERQRAPGHHLEPPAGPVRLEGTPSPRVSPDYPFPLFVTEPMADWLPPESTVVVAHGRQVLIGTRHIGLVRYDGERATWYRTNDLTAGSEKLRVACAARACFFAGGGKGFRFDGSVFAPVEVSTVPGIEVQAFVNDPSGDVIAIHSPLDGRALVLSRLVSGTESTFKPERELKIALPRGVVSVRFARYGPQGRLWLGLAFVDDERFPWGVAVVDRSGQTLYHRSTLLPSESRPKGSLALPDDIRDVQFIDGYVWVATGAGACRVRGDQVTLFTENEGMASELVHRFERQPDGALLAATHGGIGRLDGNEWRFDFTGPMSQPSRALLRIDQTLWVGTSVGLVRRRDGTERLLGAKQGLAGDVVWDLRRDSVGRLWVLTDQGLSIIGPSLQR